MEVKIGAVILIVFLALITGYTISEYPEDVPAILLVDIISILQFIYNCMK